VLVRAVDRNGTGDWTLGDKQNICDAKPRKGHLYRRTGRDTTGEARSRPVILCGIYRAKDV